MNGRERRYLEKKLGIQKFLKKETRAQKFARWRENMENGKRMMKDNLENVRISQEKDQEERMSRIISRRAEELADQEKIPLVDAMVLAQEEWENNQKKNK